MGISCRRLREGHRRVHRAAPCGEQRETMVYAYLHRHLAPDLGHATRYMTPERNPMAPCCLSMTGLAPAKTALFLCSKTDRRT